MSKIMYYISVLLYILNVIYLWYLILCKWKCLDIIANMFPHVTSAQVLILRLKDFMNYVSPLSVTIDSIHLFKVFGDYFSSAAKSLQSCPTLCDPIDGSPPGSPVPGILQARTLEWVAISFSNAGKWKVKVKSLSRVRLLANPWTAAYQAPPSMGFSRQEYWSGVPLPCCCCC